MYVERIRNGQFKLIIFVSTFCLKQDVRRMRKYKIQFALKRIWIMEQKE
jgi:hypothetical protein